MARDNVGQTVTAACFVGLCVAAILVLLLHARISASIGIGFIAALLSFIVLLVY